jgi:hypothetical protein
MLGMLFVKIPKAIQPMPPVIRQGPGGPYTPTAPTYFQQQR